MSKFDRLNFIEAEYQTMVQKLANGGKSESHLVSQLANLHSAITDLTEEDLKDASPRLRTTLAGIHATIDVAICGLGNAMVAGEAEKVAKAIRLHLRRHGVFQRKRIVDP